MTGQRQLVATREGWDGPSGVKRRDRSPDSACQIEGSEDTRQLDRLLQTIEVDIIPRLMLAHRTGAEADFRAPADSITFTNEQIDEFARLCCESEAEVALISVQSSQSAGASLENILLNLLAPTARRLGEWWESDQCDFTQVTMGLMRLHQIVHRVSPSFENELDHRTLGPRALLIAAPGEQHLFGITLVSEFFRRAGWDVCDEPQANISELRSTVRREWFDVVGLSVSCESHLEDVAVAIHTIRQASRNPDIGVMVGGRALHERPELAALVGADATAGNAPQAVAQAQNLMEVLATRRQ